MFGIPTLPKKNLVKLECLEIAGNTKITLKGIEQYVLSLVKSLNKIVFTCNDKVEADRVMKLKFWKTKMISKKSSETTIETTGLAKPLIKYWITEEEEKLKKKKSNLKNMTKASEFYGKSEMVHIVPGKSDNVGFKISSNELCYIKNNSKTSLLPPPKRRKVQIEQQSDKEDDILDLYK